MAHMSRVLRTDLEILADELENWQSILNGKQRGDGFIKGESMRFYKSEHIPEVDGPGYCALCVKQCVCGSVVKVAVRIWEIICAMFTTLEQGAIASKDTEK